ncbi:MAG: nicotinate-nucleotide adenylyltransferase [Clostridiales bacterium]|nr:nicotinate-nucleotide adenylyltransferase [Clostridiales bacterium]
MHKSMVDKYQGKNIGIMGGTFDPIHIGHLIMGEIVGQEFDLHEVIYIPVGDPPHKSGESIASAAHRYKMMKKAIADNPRFNLSDIEINRTGKTYTIDTMEQLHKVYEGANFYFIIGADSLLQIRTWKRVDELFRKCSFIVYRRWGSSDGELIEEAKNLRRIYSANIFFASGPLIGVSSTYIRESLKEGQTVKYLVPDTVLEYIDQNRIYD